MIIVQKDIQIATKLIIVKFRCMYMLSHMRLDNETLEHKWIHANMATYFRAICRAVSPTLLTALGSVSFPFTRVCAIFRYPFLMRSTKVMMVITLQVIQKVWVVNGGEG